MGDVRTYLESEVKKTAPIGTTDCYQDIDKGHGRIETRRCFVSNEIDCLSQKGLWVGLKTIVMLEKTQESNDKISTERRFFISSVPADAKRITEAVRAHWLIKNSLHWTLDVVFNEDKSRIRKDNAGENREENEAYVRLHLYLIKNPIQGNLTKKIPILLMNSNTITIIAMVGLYSALLLARMVYRHEPDLLDWDKFTKIMFILKQQYHTFIETGMVF